MAQVKLYNGRIAMKVQHLKLSRTGVYQYYRHVPVDLRDHYGREFIVKSLGTKDFTKATKLAMQMASTDDALWQSMRSPKGQELNLIPRETRAAAQALLASWGHEPGDRNSKTFDNDTILEYFEKRHGEAYREALDDEGHGVDHSSFHNGVEAEAASPKSSCRWPSPAI